jgi:hypothetical protein
VGYQTGTIGPIIYSHDNSGDNTDTDTTINYTPEQYGAPPGSQIITGSVSVTQSVGRGTAYVHNETITPDAISFDVFTQAAGSSWFWGWHAGQITVSTTFQWYCITANALKGGEALFTNEVPAVLPNAA